MIVWICFGIIFVCSLLMIINPKLGVNPKKLKAGTTYEEALKKTRTSGIILIILSLVLLLISF